MQPKISVLVIDRYPIIRWALKMYLTGHQNISTIGEVKSFSEALTIMKTRMPDVVIMDITCPEEGGIEAVSMFIKQGHAQVVAFSDIDSWDQAEAFIDAGGLGLVPRRSAIEEIAKAIVAVANNQRWIAPDIRTVNSVKTADSTNLGLTEREFEVVSLITKGLTSKQIADQLCLSINTIETHRKRIFKKLKVRRSAQLIGIAQKLVKTSL